MICAFCENKENDERVVVENKLAKAFPTTQPIVPGHILILPKRCVSKFEDLTIGERNAVFELMDKVKKALRKSFDCKGFNHAWNENLIAGQTVPHFHLHIIPRKKGDKGIYEYEPRKFIYRLGSRENSSQEELLEIASIIKDNL
ncbi:HIT family protein [Candidatus Pacearchaeota archaeon]|nr:HIT family protein [Candidatus Pacearchaeota archaeon]